MAARRLIDWSCHDSQSLNSAAQVTNSSTKQQSSNQVPKLSSHRPALERCLSQLPGRTPVLPSRVINLRLEESQQLRNYSMESSQPYEDLNLPSSTRDDVMRGNQQMISKPRPPSPLGS
ncbi:hypothetical protein O6H91_07G065000 [Diphasiastrum complanatum]|uniref:Uncharacterized protein n=2 Tax=Diphasiastrum complanatum TaxID=34168 RepID=A0ACC2D658_DIPCM|nr:hypothetical protein O6H91_07G064300 [Diphasiastrum complanatum]KAJ7549720.1 hypothetical protein O6H91_07G065000 [Diphasiastrum complanatum]